MIWRSKSTYDLTGVTCAKRLLKVFISPSHLLDAVVQVVPKNEEVELGDFTFTSGETLCFW